jgi:hypothetical protein
MQSPRLRTTLKFAAVAAGLALASYGAGRFLGTLPGRRHSGPAGQSGHTVPSPAVSAPPKAQGGSHGPIIRTAGQAPQASGETLPEASAENVVLAQKKRIMGRLKSLEHVRRVATRIRPLIDRALELPAVQADLRALAASSGMSLKEYKKYFAGKQEGDLLLESGGDPNARSSANAVGVAQYLAGTGQRCGLRVDLAASNALSWKIAGVEAQIDWLEGQPPAFSRPAPPGAKSVNPPPRAADEEASGDGETKPALSDSAPAPEGAWTRDQWIAYRKAQWEDLVAKRRRADERFDPEKAVKVQTKYLLGLTRQFGGVDWALQAYHGGEAGAGRTMGLFLSAGGGGTQLASRDGTLVPGMSRWLPYSELYRHVTPTGTPAAFSYLYGRSDDHRYYWWKVLMAERALDFYRKDREGFEKEWKALGPGMSADYAFYQDPSEYQFADNAALKAAYHEGELVSFPKAAVALGVKTANIAALDPESAPLQKGLRPEAMGALLRLAHIYRSYGGGEALVVLSMVQSSAYRQLWNTRYPPAPLPPGIPRDPEYHTTGFVFDLQRPANDWDRKVLEYAFGRLYDNLRISWRKEDGWGSRRYHVVVNPSYKAEMAEYYRKVTK